MRRYSLVTNWHLEAPVDRVWDALIAAEAWPRWWRFVQDIVELEKGDADGIGARRRYTWTSRLPYRLSFVMRTDTVVRPRLIEGTATGDLNGTGRWELFPLERACQVRYRWTVATGKRWMNLLAPALAPMFEWNHNQVMLEGGRGLARHLGVALLAFDGHAERHPDQPHRT